MTAAEAILARIRERGPITVAEFMEIALYDPEAGYYARAAQRSGRTGDFFTSVDVGPLFGEMIALQIAEMARVLDAGGSRPFDLVEAAAGNGRLSRDILDTLAAEFPGLYSTLRLSLVERSATARAQQRPTLGAHADRLAYSGPDLPRGVHGVILANELLDALPVHLLERDPAGLREVFIAERRGRLVQVLGELSEPALLHWFPARDEVPIGNRIEAGLASDAWVASAAASLDRGFLLLFDYGHEAPDLLSSVHASGTLTSYRSHTADARGWLEDPGAADLTSHVNLTAVRRAAVAGGLEPLGLVDQSYFLVGLGLPARLPVGADLASVRRRLAARTLIMPGGLGSTMKAMAFAKSPGRIALSGFSSGRLS